MVSNKVTSDITPTSSSQKDHPSCAPKPSMDEVKDSSKENHVTIEETNDLIINEKEQIKNDDTVMENETKEKISDPNNLNRTDDVGNRFSNKDFFMTPINPARAKSIEKLKETATRENNEANIHSVESEPRDLGVDDDKNETMSSKVEIDENNLKKESDDSNQDSSQGKTSDPKEIAHDSKFMTEPERSLIIDHCNDNVSVTVNNLDIHSECKPVTNSQHVSNQLQIHHETNESDTENRPTRNDQDDATTTSKNAETGIHLKNNLLGTGSKESLPSLKLTHNSPANAEMNKPNFERKEASVPSRECNMKVTTSEDANQSYNEMNNTRDMEMASKSTKQPPKGTPKSLDESSTEMNVGENSIATLRQAPNSGPSFEESTTSMEAKVNEVNTVGKELLHLNKNSSENETNIEALPITRYESNSECIKNVSQLNIKKTELEFKEKDTKLHYDNKTETSPTRENTSSTNEKVIIVPKQNFCQSTIKGDTTDTNYKATTSQNPINNEYSTERDNTHSDGEIIANNSLKKISKSFQDQSNSNAYGFDEVSLIQDDDAETDSKPMTSTTPQHESNIKESNSKAGVSVDTTFTGKESVSIESEVKTATNSQDSEQKSTSRDDNNLITDKNITVDLKNLPSTISQYENEASNTTKDLATPANKETMKLNDEVKDSKCLLSESNNKPEILPTNELKLLDRESSEILLKVESSTNLEYKFDREISSVADTSLKAEEVIDKTNQAKGNLTTSINSTTQSGSEADGGVYTSPIPDNDKSVETIGSDLKNIHDPSSIRTKTQEGEIHINKVSTKPESSDKVFSTMNGDKTGISELEQKLNEEEVGSYSLSNGIINIDKNVQGNEDNGLKNKISCRGEISEVHVKSVEHEEKELIKLKPTVDQDGNSLKSKAINDRSEKFLQKDPSNISSCKEKQTTAKVSLGAKSDSSNLRNKADGDILEKNTQNSMAKENLDCKNTPSSIQKPDELGVVVLNDEQNHTSQNHQSESYNKDDTKIVGTNKEMKSDVVLQNNSICSNESNVEKENDTSNTPETLNIVNEVGCNDKGVNNLLEPKKSYTSKKRSIDHISNAKVQLVSSDEKIGTKNLSSEEKSFVGSFESAKSKKMLDVDLKFKKKKIKKIRTEQTADIKVALYLEGTKVHRGKGAERLFADYWDALGRFIVSGVKNTSHSVRCFVDGSCTSVESLLNAFLTTRRLKRLHNKLILSVMKQCYRDKISREIFQSHIPQQWLPKLNLRGKRKKSSAVNLHDFENMSDVEIASLHLKKNCSLRIPQKPDDCRIGIEAVKDVFSTKSQVWNAFGYVPSKPNDSHKQNEAAQIFSRFGSEKYGMDCNYPSLNLPGTLSIDLQARRLTQKEGISVSETAISLLTVAVREYTSSILQLADSETKEISKGYIPALQGKNINEGTQLLSENNQRSRKRRYISISDIAHVISSYPHFSGCMKSKYSMHLSWERIVCNGNRAPTIFSGLEQSKPKHNMSMEEASWKKQKVTYQQKDCPVPLVKTNNPEGNLKVETVETNSNESKPTLETSTVRPSSSQGRGRGAKNLSALMARVRPGSSSTPPSPNENEPSEPKQPGNQESGQALGRSSSISGRGLGVKNLAALKRRPAESSNVSSTESENIADHIPRSSNGATKESTSVEVKDSTSSPNNKLSLNSSIGRGAKGKQLMMLRQAEEKRKLQGAK